MNQKRQALEDGAVKVMAHLFKTMCADDPQLQSPEDRRRVQVAFFVGWMQESIDLVNGVELVAELGVPPESWDFVVNVAHTGNAPLVMAVWPRIVLGDAAPKNALRSFHLVTLLEWDDGRMVPISVYTPKEFAPNSELTDGIVASMLNQQIAATVQSIIEGGLDGMWEHMADTYGGEHVFDVMMGAMLKVIPQLDPKLQPYLHKWMRLFQGLIRPPIPPHLVKHIEEVRRRKAAEGQTSEAPRGGWNT